MSLKLTLSIIFFYILFQGSTQNWIQLKKPETDLPARARPAEGCAESGDWFWSLSSLEWTWPAWKNLTDWSLSRHWPIWQKFVQVEKVRSSPGLQYSVFRNPNVPETIWTCCRYIISTDAGWGLTRIASLNGIHGDCQDESLDNGSLAVVANLIQSLQPLPWRNTRYLI